MKKYLWLSAVALLMACGGSKTDNENNQAVLAEKNESQYPKSLVEIFNAHGGYAQWAKMKQLSYDMPNGQHHLIELQNRYTRIESDKQTIGYDGQQVWVMPEDSNASRVNMTYNLYFYFYAFPFVIGDPGIFYEEVEPKEILGKTYNGLKVTYGDGVGASPKDIYIIYSDPETHEMGWLMYTATFGADQASDRFNLIKYDQWQDVNGVLLPKVLKWYQFGNGEVGDARNEVIFENVKLSTEEPSMDYFTMPEGAKIASGQ